MKISDRGQQSCIVARIEVIQSEAYRENCILDQTHKGDLYTANGFKSTRLTPSEVPNCCEIRLELCEVGNADGWWTPVHSGDGSLA